jgi:toxin CcdB
MSQFDIHANPFRRSRDYQPFLVVVQSDYTSQDIDTVVVAPLEVANAGRFIDRLNPSVKFGNRSFILIIQDLLTMRKSQLGDPRGSLHLQRDQIIAAIDMLFMGI